jgi:thioredoxin 1
MVQNRCGATVLGHQKRGLAIQTVETLDQFAAFKSATVSKGGLAYFTAAWCGPCKMIAPVFKKLSEDNAGIAFAKIDVDDAADVAAEHKIRSMPTFVSFVNGKEVSRFSGASSALLEQAVAELKTETE